MYQAGQSCISVQRVLRRTRTSTTRLAEKVLSQVQALRTGDPRADGVDVGPLINEDAAARVSRGSPTRSAGRAAADRRPAVGATVEPTVLADVPEDASVMAEEVFGPVVSLVRVRRCDEGIERINASRFGLQAGVFTRDLPTAFEVRRG